MTRGTARGSGSLGRGVSSGRPRTASPGGDGQQSATAKTPPEGDGLAASPAPTASPTNTTAPAVAGSAPAPAPLSPGTATHDGTSGGGRALPATPVTFDGGSLLGAAGIPLTATGPTTGEYQQIRIARRKRVQRFALFLTIVLLVAEFIWLSPFTDSIALAPPRQPVAVPLAEVQPWGVNTFLHKEVDSWKKEKTLQMAQDLGVGWIKQQFPWAEIEYRLDPQRPFWDVKNNQNAWTKFDNIASLAQQHGLRVIARIDSTPAWARPGNSDPKAPPAGAQLADFAAFIETFVSRYRGSVAAIQVWNEPNLRAEWGGKPANAAEYTELLRTAYEAAKRANPDIIILAAPLATNNESLAYAGNLNELDYLQAMYDAGAREYFDAMSANAYGTTFAPEDEPSRQKLNFRRVELLHDIMVKNGDSNKAVWFNEYGWNASPAEVGELPWGRVSADEQGDYTVRGIRYAREHWPWAGVFTIWYLRQVGDIARTKSEYYFGLVDPDFVASPAYRAIQAAASADQRVATPGAWGPLSSPVESEPRWRLRLSDDVPGGAYLSPSALNVGLRVPFAGTGVSVQLVPAPTEGAITDTQKVAARYYVTIDGTSSLVAPELSRDATGAAYIDVPSIGKPTEVELARGINAELRTGEHTLEIRAASQPGGLAPRYGGRAYSPVVQSPDLPGIGLISVQADRSYLMFGLLTAILLATAGYLVWLLRKAPPAPEALSAGR